MSAASDYLEQAILNHVLRGSAYTSPGTVYLALFTAAPSDAGGGTEAAYSGYVRQAAAFSAPGATNGVSANSATITFPAVAGSQITATHFAIFDASTGGNMLIHGALTASKVLDVNDVPSFPASSLSVTLG